MMISVVLPKILWQRQQRYEIQSATRHTAHVLQHHGADADADGEAERAKHQNESL